MHMAEKGTRMRWISFSDQRTVIIQMDHGFTYGQMPGLSDIDSAIHAVSLGGAREIVLHIGVARRFTYLVSR